MAHETVLHIFGGIVSKDPEKLRNIRSADGRTRMLAGQISNENYSFEIDCADGIKHATGKLVEGIMIMDTAQSGTMFVEQQPPKSTIDGIKHVEHLITFKPASQCEFTFSDPDDGGYEEGRKITMLPCLYLNQQTFSDQ